MTEGDLRVWWIPQVPMPAFHVPVSDVTEGLFMMAVLARYDLFQFEHNVKPDYLNVGGLEVYHDGDWEEWETEEGETASDLCWAESFTDWADRNEERMWAERSNRGHGDDA